MAFFELNRMQGIPYVEGISSKAIYGNKCSAYLVDLKPMSRVPVHHHPNEQIGVVLKGEIEYTIGNETRTCRKGSAMLIPPNTPHSLVVVSLDPAQMLDIFAPPRDLQAAWSQK